ERYYPKECYLLEERRKYNAVADYIYWREDGGAFTCNTKDGYRAFNTRDMSKPTPLVGDSRYALQVGVFSGKESILTRLNRARQAEEISPIDELTYQYQTPLKGDRVSGFSLYVPANLLPHFSDYDLRQEFPALPSHSQFKDAYARYLASQEQKCKKVTYENSSGEDIFRCERTCQIEKQGNVFVTTHCDSNKVK
ncbi:hypothetical protein AAFX23_12800, partial [Vibrio alginolyticus]